MPTAVERRFTLFDAMVLIAATAVAVKVIQPWLGPAPRIFYATFRDTADVWLTCLGTLLFYWAIALVFLRLRGPRPPLRRLGSQPGFIACLTVALTFLFRLLDASYVFIDPGRGRGRVERLGEMLLAYTGAQFVAPAIMLSWIVLVLARRWRAERGWIDRVGRVIGWLWIAIYAVMMAGTCLRAAFRWK